MRHVVATVEPWQHSSPHGGFITTDYVRAPAIEPGMVTDHAGEYCPIVAVWSDRRSRLIVVAVALSSGDVAHRALDAWEGVHVRRDLRWAPLPIARCGCWASDTGRWTCDKHLRRRELRRRAATRLPATQPLRHLARSERNPMTGGDRP